MKFVSLFTHIFYVVVTKFPWHFPHGSLKKKFNIGN
jgi:hypothetical protein